MADNIALNGAAVIFVRPMVYNDDGELVSNGTPYEISLQQLADIIAPLLPDEE